MILNLITDYPPVKDWEWEEVNPNTATCTRQGGDGKTLVTHEVTLKDRQWWVTVSCPVCRSVTGTGETLQEAWEEMEEFCAEGL